MNEMADAELERWNGRFAAEELVFGTAPNALLASQAWRLRPDMCALCVALASRLRAAPAAAASSRSSPASSSPRSSGWPMRMRADFPSDTKRATLVHALAHRLISPLVPRRFDDHPVIFLFVYGVRGELWGGRFAFAQVAAGRARQWAAFLSERRRSGWRLMRRLLLRASAV